VGNHHKIDLLRFTIKKDCPPYNTTEDLDQKFDNGEDVLEYFDLSTLKRPVIETKK
jgi:hypothetical protein